MTKKSESEKFIHYPEKLGKHGGMIKFNAVGKVSRNGKMVTKILKTISIRDTGGYKENLVKARARFGKELKGKDLRAWNRYSDYIEVIDLSAKEVN